MNLLTSTKNNYFLFWIDVYNSWVQKYKLLLGIFKFSKWLNSKLNYFKRNITAVEKLILDGCLFCENPSRLKQKWKMWKLSKEARSFSEKAGNHLITLVIDEIH